MSWVVGRGASGSATLMHQINTADLTRTLCGRDLTGWSRAYVNTVIPQIACKVCMKRSEGER